jgi:hypothetical protein
VTTLTPATGERPGFGMKAGTWLAFALMLVIMLSSAYIRLVQAGGADDALDLARGVHRLAATLALVVIVGVAILGWDSLQPLKSSRIVAGALVGLAFALGLLGLFTPSDDLVVTFGNPLGGLAMTGCAWWLCLAAGTRRARAQPAPVAASLTVATAFIVVAATVIWPPPLVAGLAIQLVATILLIVGVSLLYRSAR